MAIQKKTEGRDLDEYLQEVWDSLEPAWDKSKFDMKQGYDSEYECDCITITSKDNEGVRAKIYVNDYEGKHPVGFDVVYRYPGDKGVGVMGSYEFQSTDMDGLGEEVFDYFDEIKKKVGESKKSEAESMNAIEKFAKEHGAEYEDEKTLAPLFKEAVQSVIGEKGTVGSAWTYTGSNNYGYVDWEASITGVDGMLPEDEIVIVLSTSLDDGVQWLGGRYMDENDTIAEAEHPAGDGQFDPLPIVDRLLAEVKKDRGTSESKKSEADATFKVGDFVNYDAESDGKDVYDSFIPCEVVAVNDDGTLGLCVYGSYADEEGLGEKASASCCRKLDNYAGMVDANTYYTDGKYKAYKGGWEILVTEKELDPKVYEFIGTMDDLSEVVDFDDYYGGENFVYDEDLRDDLGATGVDTDGVDFADMSGDVAQASGSPEESKKSEGLPPKKLGDRRYRSRADLINKMKQLGATEITTRDQYDELRGKQWLHKGGYAMDINGNLVGQTYFGDKDGKWYYASSKTFQGDYLPECKKSESKADGERAVDDYDTLIDGLEAFGFELSSSVRNGMFYPYRTRFTATKDGVKYGFTLNEDSTGEYLESIEVGGGIFDKGDPNDPDATKFNSVGDLLDALKKMDGKESEAKKSEGDEDKVVPDENDFEKCPYCGSHNTDIHYEVDLAKPADVLAYATCKDCGKEYHGQFVFTGAYYGKDEHDYDPIDTCPFCGSKEHTETVQFDGGGYVDQDFKCKSCGGTWYNSFVWSDTQSAFESHTHKAESKKSESLTLKQKELKDMARFGQAEDITTISDEEAKALRKKGIETVGISRGTYGMNGALLRDNEGKKYVITARSSNLFYFV